MILKIVNIKATIRLKTLFKKKRVFKTNDTYTQDCYLTITSLSHSLGSLRNIASIFDEDDLSKDCVTIADDKINSVIVDFQKRRGDKNSLENTLKLEECTF